MRLNHTNEIQYFLNTWNFHFHFIITLIVIIIIIINYPLWISWLNHLKSFPFDDFNGLYDFEKDFRTRFIKNHLIWASAISSIILKSFCIQPIKIRPPLHCHRYNKSLMFNCLDLLLDLELLWSDMFAVRTIDPKIFDLHFRMIIRHACTYVEIWKFQDFLGKMTGHAKQPRVFHMLPSL